ncbi:oxidoreductase [Shewanella sairae]|uniref:Oxidoreductase n=1 Tax=Shewanella sairae TaxID=190310 RepID=A0ABQ4P191_9GAMM|nr:aldo/keto reductase [Shewanella sairae]MCL1129612.1 aldo/keto reductase [Shewanella sairae]GIU40930.1 oxidoreductase [Shewanella sairae]
MQETALQLSQFIAGFWRTADRNTNTQQRLALIQGYLDLGVYSMDHADIYGGYQCEQLFGEALALAPALRDKMQIISKCGIRLVNDHNPDVYLNHYDTTSEHIIASVENSLTRLKTDYLDLLLIHRPDPLMDANAVAHAFGQLQQQGKVLHFGVSNFTPQQFDLLQSRVEQKLVCNQVEISPSNMSALHDGTLDHCQQHKLKPMAWSCLGGGDIFNATDPKSIRLRSTLASIADEVGAENISQVIYAWVLALPSKPHPIIGSGNIERIRSAVKATELRLTRQQWFSIWQASTGHGVP